jgi:hypothetical protein
MWPAGAALSAGAGQRSNADGAGSRPRPATPHSSDHKARRGSGRTAFLHMHPLIGRAMAPALTLCIRAIPGCSPTLREAGLIVSHTRCAAGLSMGLEASLHPEALARAMKACATPARHAAGDLEAPLPCGHRGEDQADRSTTSNLSWPPDRSWPTESRPPWNTIATRHLGRRHPQRRPRRRGHPAGAAQALAGCGLSPARRLYSSDAWA